MKKFIFLLAFFFLASFSFVSAQNLATPYPEVSFSKPGECAPHGYTKDDAVLKYITGNPTVALGIAAPTGTRYTSGCINFTQAQMNNYVGATLHQINVGVAPLSSMPTLVSYKIWIKTAMDGPIVYQEIVTPVLDATYHWENYPLATNYTITNAPLVIGFTAEFSGTSAFYPLACTNVPADTYQEGGFNYINAATSPTAHEAGASWLQYTTAGNLAIEALLTNVTPLPANDLAASLLVGNDIKWVDHETPYAVTVFNAGTASQNNYTVQLLDASDAVVGSQTVTTALAAGASAVINVNYAPTSTAPFVLKGKVVLSGDENNTNDVSEPVTFNKIYAQEPMGYCWMINSSAYGAASTATFPTTGSAAIGYTATQMANFVGKQLVALDICIPTAPSGLDGGTIWIRNSTTGADLYTQAFTPIEGWQTITLNTPYDLTNTSTFIGYTVNIPVFGAYPLGYSANAPGNANGGHFAIGTSWYTLAGQSVVGNMNIIGVVEGEGTPPEPSDDCPITIEFGGLWNDSWGSTAPGGVYVYVDGALFDTYLGDNMSGSNPNYSKIVTPLIPSGNVEVKIKQGGYNSEKWVQIYDTDGNLVGGCATAGCVDSWAEGYVIATFAHDCGEPQIECDDYEVAPSATPNNNSGYVPINTYYGNNYTQMIYEPADIGTTGEITSIKLNTLRTITRDNVTVYMANTTKTVFTTNNDWIDFGDLTAVYQGAVNLIADDWIELTITPFNYTGGNLAVVFLNTQLNNGDGSAASANVHNTTTDLCLNYYADGSGGINPQSLPNNTCTYARPKTRANISFHICGEGITPPPGDCNPPQSLAVSYEPATCDAILTWEPPTGKKSITYGPTATYEELLAKGLVEEKERENTERTAAAVSMARNQNVTINKPIEEGNNSKAYGDLLWYFNVDALQGALGNFAPFMWDGNLYINKWNAASYPGFIGKYVRNGSNWTYAGTQTITGVPTSSGLNPEGFATDGDYIYACNGGPNIYKIDPATWTSIATIACTGYIDAIAYDAVNDGFWIAEYQTTSAYRVAKTGGSTLQTLTSSVQISDLAWENTSDGTPYLWMISTDNLNLHRWNLTTNALQLNAKPTTDVPGMDYTAASGAGLFIGIDAVLGKNVLIALCEGDNDTAFSYELSDAGDPCPAVSNVTATANNNNVTITWTAATGSPLSYDVMRNGTQIGNVTTTTYTDNNVPVGQYTYSVKALFSDDCFPQTVSAQPIIVGDVCFADIITSSYTYGDSFSWWVKDNATNTPIIGAGSQSGFGSITTGTLTAMLTGDATFELWQHGTYTDNGITLSINVNGTTVYSFSLNNIPAGFTTSGAVPCEGGVTPSNITYKVYRGTELLGTTTDLTYTDTGWDQVSATWNVTAVCEDGGESVPATVNGQECVTTCPTIQNLSIVYNAGCGADLTWDPSKGNSKACDDVPVGNGTSGTCRIPLNSFYNSSYSQQIYTAADLGNISGGNINSVAMEWFYSSPWTFNNVKIYVGHTTKNNFPSSGQTASDWETPSALTLVYEAPSVTVNNSQTWTTFQFQTPFEYTGGNIVVAFLFGMNSGYQDSNPHWRTHTNSNAMNMFYQSDGTLFSINAPQTPTSGYSSDNLMRANTIFNICTGGGGGDKTFVITRDGDEIAQVTETFYNDYGFDYMLGHTWGVTVICSNGLESDEVTGSLGACEEEGNCNPAQNLEGEYTMMCDIELTWEPPVGKKSSTYTPPAPREYTPIDPELAAQMHAEREGQEALAIQRGGTNSNTEVSPTAGTPTKGDNSKAMWDVALRFSTNASSMVAIGSDGNNFYSANWSSTGFEKFDMNGNFISSFTIPGVDQVRCLAYDGTHFYAGSGSATSGNIRILDMNTQTQIGTIPNSGGGALRHMSYDPNLDGGNGGFWIGDWYTIRAISMTGTILFANSDVESVYGSAYDPYTNPGNPCLWLFTQTGTNLNTLLQWDINTHTFTGFSKDVSTDIANPGYEPGYDIAGGAFAYEYDATFYLAVNVQRETPNTNDIIVYELATLNPNLAKAPTNVTLTPQGTSLNGNFAWTNPSTTLGGDPITITNIVVERDGAFYQDYTTNLTPGANCSMNVSVTSEGSHSFAVYAVTSEGNGSKGSASATFGDMCEIHFEMFDDYGDGWNGGTLTVQVNGTTYGTVAMTSGGYGTTDILVSGGELTFIWNTGSFDCECEFQAYDPEGELIYSSPANGSYPCGTPGVGMYGLSGAVYTDDFSCGGGAGTYYVYRDGSFIGTSKVPAYTDSGFDPTELHHWKVTVTCEDGSESAGIYLTKDACASCYGPVNLEVEYADDCEGAYLTWEEQGKKSNTVVKPTVPENQEFRPREGKPVAVNARSNPNSYTIEELPIFEELGDGLFRGDNSPLIYSTPSSDATVGTFKTTLAGYNQSGTQLSTISLSYQAMIYAYGEIGVVTYNDGTGANTFGKLDPDNGTFTLVNSNNSQVPDAISMAYNPLDDEVYVTQWQAPFGKINMSTGVFTSIAPKSDVLYIAIDLDGTCYYLSASGSGSDFGTMNLANGQTTSISSYPAANWIQDIAIDPETGILYHAFRDGVNSTTQWRTINKATGAPTTIGNFPSGRNVESFVIMADFGDPCPAVSNVTTTVKGHNVTVNWTAATGNPTSYEVYRNGQLLQAVTPPTVTYLDSNVPDGQHIYGVKAIFPAANDCIPQTVNAPQIMVGNMCFIHFEMFDNYGDGWNNGSVAIQVDGTSYGTATLTSGMSYGTTDILVPNGELKLIWSAGSYDCECEFQAYHPNGDLIYTSPANGSFPCGTPGVGMYGLAGTVYTGDFTCSGASGAYNIYRDGELVAEGINDLEYFDTGFDHSQPHTWCVVSLCEDGTESVPACKEMAKCSCDPVENLTGYYNEDCNVVLSWDEATGKSIIYTPEDVVVDPEVEAAHLAQIQAMEQEKMLQNQKSPIQFSASGVAPNINIPTSKANDWIKWCGDNVDAIGLGQPVTFTLMSRFLPEDLAAMNVFNGDLLTHIKFVVYYASANTVTLEVYQGGTSPTDPGTLVYSQLVTQPLVNEDYTDVELTTPVIIDASQELWIGYEVVHTGYNHPAGNDAGPRVAGKGDLMYWDGSWTDLWTASGTNYISANWNIEAYIEVGNVNLAKSPTNFTAEQIGNTFDVALSWTNPSQTLGGAPLTSISQIVLQRDDVTINTFNNPAVGGNMTFTDNVPGNGTYNYKVYAVTGEGQGGSATTSLKVKVKMGGCDDYEVGEGTGGSYQIPFNDYWKNSYSQQIFDETFLAGYGIKPGMKIQSIAFEWFYNGSWAFTNPQIYMGTTTKMTFASSNDWVSPASLTMVWSATSFTFDNSEQWTVIDLDEPFVYEGGNLVVAANYGTNANYLNSTAKFRTHTASGNQSMYYYSDTAPFNITSPQAGTTSNVRNNVVLNACPVSYNIYEDGVKIEENWGETSYTYLATNPWNTHTYEVTVNCMNGKESPKAAITLEPCEYLERVSGYVFNCVTELPMEGVTATISYLDLETTTDADGYYTHPYVNCDKYQTVTGSMPGYYTNTTEPFFVACGEETMAPDLCLQPIPEWIVFGDVRGCDDSFIVGAEVTLVSAPGNEHHYEFETTTGQFGQFEFPEVYMCQPGESYILTVTKQGWEVSETVVVVFGNTNAGRIILYNIIEEPSVVEAVEAADYQSAIVTWTAAPAPLPGVSEILGYKLWRLIPGQETNETLWSILTNDPVNDVEFIDNAWANYTPGIYKYAVKTAYCGDLVSDPIFSNEIVKNIEVGFEIKITTECENNPLGAVVTLTNDDYQYELPSTNTGAFFPKVWLGTYDLKVTLAGYEDYTATVEITAAGSHDALLKLIVKDPNNLQVDTLGNTAHLTWSFDAVIPIAGFTIYLNNEVVKTGVTATEYYFADLVNGDYKAEVEANYCATITSAKKAIEFTIFVPITPGVDDYEFDYNLYPNPTTEMITIQRSNACEATIELYNAMGMHISTYETTEHQLEINVGSLAVGTYFIRINEGDKSTVKSFVKK